MGLLFIVLEVCPELSQWHGFPTRPNGARNRASVYEACSMLIILCNTKLASPFHFG